jgi:hypothetical protein
MWPTVRWGYPPPHYSNGLGLNSSSHWRTSCGTSASMSMCLRERYKQIADGLVHILGDTAILVDLSLVDNDLWCHLLAVSRNGIHVGLQPWTRWWCWVKRPGEKICGPVFLGPSLYIYAYLCLHASQIFRCLRCETISDSRAFTSGNKTKHDTCTWLHFERIIFLISYILTNEIYVKYTATC